MPSTEQEIIDLKNDINTLSEDYLGYIKLESNGEYVAWEDFNMDITYSPGNYINREFTDDMWVIGAGNINNTDIGNEFFYIGRKLIIKEYIGGEAYGEQETYWVNGVAYTRPSSFNVFSDQDNFSFGVYRNNILLTDNNVSVLS